MQSEVEYSGVRGDPGEVGVSDTRGGVGGKGMLEVQMRIKASGTTRRHLYERRHISSSAYPTLVICRRDTHPAHATAVIALELLSGSSSSAISQSHFWVFFGAVAEHSRRGDGGLGTGAGGCSILRLLHGRLS